MAGALAALANSKALPIKGRANALSKRKARITFSAPGLGAFRAPLNGLHKYWSDRLQQVVCHIFAGMPNRPSGSPQRRTIQKPPVIGKLVHVGDRFSRAELAMPNGKQVYSAFWHSLIRRAAKGDLQNWLYQTDLRLRLPASRRRRV